MLLEILIIGMLMGILGQGARAVVGLKGMSDNAVAQGLNPNDLFEAARLLTSFLIGSLVGLASALVYLKGFDSIAAAKFPEVSTLLAWAAAAYAGTDALEGVISQYLSPTTQITQTAKAKAATNNITLANLKGAAILLTDQPGQKEGAILDCITTWLQGDGKLASNQYVDPQGTMNGTYHFNGATEIKTFLQGVSDLLIKQQYHYDCSKDINSQTTPDQLSTATVTAVAYQIGKSTMFVGSLIS